MGRSLETAVSDPTYLDFFGLTQPPFAPLDDPSRLFISEQYSLLMEHLSNAVSNTDSLVVVCGADGCGKSTLLNRFVAKAGDDISCVVIDESCHGEEQFYRAFLTQIGFEDITGSTNELRNITKEFLVCRGIASDHVLIIIDNAHLTDPMILEQLRWLCKIIIKDHRVLSVVLAGNADIVRVVDAPAMRQTKFRNHAVFSIRNYSEEETACYVWHRLALAGGNDGVKLQNEASLLIHRYSGGVPHLINRLCDAMLAEAYGLKSRVITDKMVRTAADKLKLLPHVIPLHGKGRRKSDPDFQHVRAVSETKAAPSENAEQQITRLSAQIDDLRADKARALEDIDVRNNDIILLRDELALRTMELEKLKRSVATDADAISQRERALSDSAAALLASEDRASKLVADLDQEIRARKAVEEELAEIKGRADELSQLKKQVCEAEEETQADERAAEIEALEKNAAALQAEIESKSHELDSLRGELATANEEFVEIAANLEEEIGAREAVAIELATSTALVEELRQQKRELQATVDATKDELKADRRVASGRAVEIEDYKKNVAELNGDIEIKTNELDRLQDELGKRDKILADLEMRLDQSQSACELAQQRIVALKSPAELAEMENALDELAADLAKETHARKSAEAGLAKVTATVEELQSVHEDLVTLQNSVAGREETLADLESRLEESQADYETAQRRIAALINPEELEEVEKVSDELAADLRKEKRARKAAEKELAKATATVEDLQQSKQQLQDTVDQVQAEFDADRDVANRRAAEIENLKKNASDLKDEIEGKSDELSSLNDELTSLQDRLASRDQDVADLESWLEESQADRASALQQVSAMKRPEEFEEVERASVSLTAKLEQEVLAKEAAQNELAEATTSVEELRQLESELRAQVRDLNADLTVAGERAIDASVLEKNVTNLEDQLEQRTRELDSRDRVIADLEKQLTVLRNERDALKPRAAVPNNIDVPESIVDDIASNADTGTYSSQVVNRFEQSLRKVPAYQALHDHEPAFYDDLIATYKRLIGLDHTDKQVNDVLRAKQAKLMEKLLPKASADAIVAYARLIVDQLDELLSEHTEPSLTLLIPQSSPHIKTSPVYSEKTKGRELDILEITLRTYEVARPIPEEDDVWPDLGPIFAELFDDYGADNVAAMENSYDSNVDRLQVCNVTRALYSGVLELPKSKAANALRWLLSTE